MESGSKLALTGKVKEEIFSFHLDRPKRKRSLPVIFPSLEDRQTLRKITEVILYCQEGLLSQTKVEQFSFSQVLAD